MIPLWRKLIYYFGIGTGLVIFLYQLWLGGQALYQGAVRLESMEYLFAAWGITVVAYGLQMFAWFLIMQKLGTAIHVPTMLQGYVISFIPRYIPGTVWGYLSRGEWLRTRHNISYLISTTGSVLEAGLIILSAGIVTGIYFFWPDNSQWGKILTICAGGFLVWIIWYALRYIQRFLATKQINRLKYFKLDLIHWYQAIIIYFLMWGCYGLSLIWVMRAFDISQDGTTLFQTAFIFSFAWLAGFLVFIVPSGLGIREFIMSALLVSQLFLPSESASIITIVSRFLIYPTEIVWLIIGVLIPSKQLAEFINPER